MLFLAIGYICGSSVHILLFRYGVDKWNLNWYFGMGNGIFEMELVCTIDV